MVLCQTFERGGKVKNLVAKRDSISNFQDAISYNTLLNSMIEMLFEMESLMYFLKSFII